MSSGYVYEIKSINSEISRLNKVLKELKKQREISSDNLYKYMKSHNLEEIDGIKIKNIIPASERTPKKKLSEKKNDAILFLKHEGINNPEDFFERLNESIKSINCDE